MKTAWIIGTSHHYQMLRHGVTDVGSERFRRVLTALSSENDLRAIGEEMSPEGLRKAGAHDSVCRQVAEALDIRHRYCDPSCEERRALGIAKGDPVLESRLWADCEEREFAPEVRNSYDRRRRRWLEHLLEMDAWPLLFVCGANHAKAFREVCLATAMDAHVLFSNWSPS